MPKFDDRFARQNRCGPPPEFPLASSYSGIVHHLSGPNVYALAPPLLLRAPNPPVRGRTDPTQAGRSPGLHFHCAFGFRSAQRLAHMLDSLVRVSRRVGQVTGRFATDPRRDAGRARRCGRAVRGQWNQSPRVERDNTTGGRRRSATVFFGPPTGRRSPGLYAPAHEAKVTLPGSFSPPTNRSWRSARRNYPRPPTNTPP